MYSYRSLSRTLFAISQSKRTQIRDAIAGPSFLVSGSSLPPLQSIPSSSSSFPLSSLVASLHITRAFSPTWHLPLSPLCLSTHHSSPLPQSPSPTPPPTIVFLSPTPASMTTASTSTGGPSSNDDVAAGGTSPSSSSSSSQQEQQQQRFRVYTRTGDKGSSSLYNGERRRKDDRVFAALGDVDELNSAVGLAQEHCRLQGLEETCKQLSTIQSRLLDVGSAVATPLPSSSASKLARVRFDAAAVPALEQWIDAMDQHLPPLRFFILPSGGLAAAHLHLARSICRRAERSVVALNFSALLADDLPPAAPTPAAITDTTSPSPSASDRKASSPASDVSVAAVEEGDVEVVEPAVRHFLNRLSDYLFVAARFAAHKAGREETAYQKAS